MSSHCHICEPALARHEPTFKLFTNLYKDMMTPMLTAFGITRDRPLPLTPHAPAPPTPPTPHPHPHPGHAPREKRREKPDVKYFWEAMHFLSDFLAFF